MKMIAWMPWHERHCMCSPQTLAFLLPAMTLAIQRAEAMFKAGQSDVPLQVGLWD